MSRIARCLVFLVVLGPAAAGRATVLYGEVEAVSVSDGSTWWEFDEAGDTPVPFGLDANSLAGVHATIRLWLDLGAVPEDGYPDSERTQYLTEFGPPDWLVMEIEINGVTTRPGPGPSILDLYSSGADPTHPENDDFQLSTATFDAVQGANTEILQLVISGNDLGPSAVIPTALELTRFGSMRAANVFNVGVPGGYLSLDFDLISARMHAVGEPSGVTLLPYLALLAARLSRAAR